MTVHHRDMSGKGGFQSPPMSFADIDVSAWRRDAYTIALVGPIVIDHRDLVARAGYRVVVAESGDAASELFGRGLVVDAIVLEFENGGRPPEAVLLFARRAASDVQLIAVVPPNRDESYRRAFLAGARDVLQSPPRGEDLLAAIDLVLEPRGLADMVEELRARGFDDDGTQPINSVEDRILVVKMESELRELRLEVDRLQNERDESVTTFRQQALDAITERDRLLEGRDGLRKKLSVARRDLKERDAQLSLLERACEELQRKLKDARDQRRESEARLLEVEARGAMLSSTNARGEGGPFSPVIPETRPGVVDPEDALSHRAVDEARLAELETTYARYQVSLGRIESLEAQLRARQNASDGESIKVATGEQRARHALIGERDELAQRIQTLESDLARRDDELHRVRTEGNENASIALEVALAELEDLRESGAETLGRLDAVRTERDGLKRRISDSEREAADALTRVEELAPLLEELERVRRELHVERQNHEALRSRHDVLVARSVSVDAGDTTPVPTPPFPRSMSGDAAKANDDAERLVDDARALEDEVSAQEAELQELKAMIAALDRGDQDAGPEMK